MGENFFTSALCSREMVAGREESKKVCQIAGAQASSTDVGRRVPSHDMGFQ